QSLEQKWETAQKNLQTAREAFTKAEANLSNAEKQLTESKRKREDAEERFKTAMKNAEFSTEESYREAKLDEAGQKKLKEEIKEFSQQLTTRSEERRVGKECRDRNVTGVQTCALPILKQKQTYRMLKSS